MQFRTRQPAEDKAKELAASEHETFSVYKFDQHYRVIRGVDREAANRCVARFQGERQVF